MRGRTFTRFAALGAAIVLLTTGCLTKPAEFGSGGTETGDKQVEIFGAFPGDEAKAFEASLVPFEAVRHRRDLRPVDRLHHPDPQPRGRAAHPGHRALPPARSAPGPGRAQAVRRPRRRPRPEPAQVDALPGALDSTTVDGKVYGAPMRLAVKSLVWYPVPEFKEAGYTIPKTDHEMLALTDKIKADGQHAVVPRDGVRRGDRLGGHRLDRGVRPAHRRAGGLRPVGAARDPVHRPASSSRRPRSSQS